MHVCAYVFLYRWRRDYVTDVESNRMSTPVAKLIRGFWTVSTSSGEGRVQRSVPKGPRTQIIGF